MVRRVIGLVAVGLAALLFAKMAAAGPQDSAAALCRQMARDLPADLGQSQHQLRPLLRKAVKDRVVIFSPHAPVMTEGGSFDHDAFRVWLSNQASFEDQQKRDIVEFMGRAGSAVYRLETAPAMTVFEIVGGTLNCQGLLYFVHEADGSSTRYDYPQGGDEGRWCRGARAHPVALDGRPAQIVREDGRGRTSVQAYLLPMSELGPPSCQLDVTHENDFHSSVLHCEEADCSGFNERLEKRLRERSRTARAETVDVTGAELFFPRREWAVRMDQWWNYRPASVFWLSPDERRHLVVLSDLSSSHPFGYDAFGARVLRVDGDGFSLVGLFQIGRINGAIIETRVQP